MKHHPEITDDMISIFVAILSGGETNMRLAANLIRKLDATGRRDLRATLQQLDYLLDDVFLSEQREKRIKNNHVCPSPYQQTRRHRITNKTSPFTALACQLALIVADAIDCPETPEDLRDALCGIIDEITNAIGPSVSESLRAVASVVSARDALPCPAVEKRNGRHPRANLSTLNADSLVTICQGSRHRGLKRLTTSWTP
jgi:hypothetical protein